MDKVAKMLAAGLSAEDVCMLRSAELMLGVFQEHTGPLEHMVRKHDHLQTARFMPQMMELMLNYSLAIENAATMIEDKDTMAEMAQLRRDLKSDLMDAKELQRVCEEKHELLHSKAN